MQFSDGWDFNKGGKDKKKTSSSRYIWANYSDLSGGYFTQVYMRYWGLRYLVTGGCAIKHSKDL